MKNTFSVVALWVTSTISSGTLFLPTAHASECALVADSCSTDSGATECCFTELGAVCDANSNGGSCCFPIKDDPDALCTQNDDCCGTLLCIAGLCSDTITFSSQMAEYTIIQTETEYGSGEYIVSSVTAQQEGQDAVTYVMGAAGEVVYVYSAGKTLYPIPETLSRRLRSGTEGSSGGLDIESEASVRRFQILAEGGSATVEVSNLNKGNERSPKRIKDIARGTPDLKGVERSSTRQLTPAALAICETAVNAICLIGGGLACAILATFGGVAAATCTMLITDACDAAAATITTLCESIVDCEGDPHMRGLQGQKFDFSGKDGAWYAILHDESFLVNMRVTAPIPGLEEITYITGLGISIVDQSGELRTVVMTVDHPLEMQSECPDLGEVCLADGALSVELDGVKRTTPGEVSLGGGVFFAAANIPGECRPFGFEKYWQKKAAAQSNTLMASPLRRLDLAPTSLWILSDEHKTNPAECRTYVRSGLDDGTLFDYRSEHTSMQIRATDLSIRVNHGKIHQLAMRDPTDQYDLPDHIAYQMNIDFERLNVGQNPKGVIGSTAHIAKDEYGHNIMTGPDVFPGEEEDYRVSGPLDTDFVTPTTN